MASKPNTTKGSPYPSSAPPPASGTVADVLKASANAFPPGMDLLLAQIASTMKDAGAQTDKGRDKKAEEMFKQREKEQEQKLEEAYAKKAANRNADKITMLADLIIQAVVAQSRLPSSAGVALAMKAANQAATDATIMTILAAMPPYAVNELTVELMRRGASGEILAAVTKSSLMMEVNAARQRIEQMGQTIQPNGIGKPAWGIRAGV